MKLSKIKLETIENFEKDDEKHLYFLNNVMLDNVSKILEILGGGFVSFNALDRGSAVHLAIETFILYGIDTCPREYDCYYSAFKKWYDDYGKNLKLISTEREIYHKKFLYAGTFDLLVEDENGNIVLIDYKTSDAVNTKRTIAQLTLYAMALESLGIKVDKLKILVLSSNAEYRYEEVDMNLGIALSLIKINEFIK